MTYRLVHVETGFVVARGSPSSFTTWRKRLRLSKVAAAEALGISRETIARYERGDYPIPRTIALACAAIALGIPPIGKELSP